MPIITLLDEVLRDNHRATRYLFRGLVHVPYPVVEATSTQLSLIGDYFMARKGKNGGKRQNSFGIDFVNLKVDNGRKAEAKKWVADCADNILVVLPEFMTDGYKFGLKWDADNETYIVSMTQTDEGHVNAGLCLTSRSDDWLEALCLNLFKTRVMCKDDVWPQERQSDNWG